MDRRHLHVIAGTAAAVATAATTAVAVWRRSNTGFVLRDPDRSPHEWTSLELTREVHKHPDLAAFSRSHGPVLVEATADNKALARCAQLSMVGRTVPEALANLANLVSSTHRR